MLRTDRRDDHLRCASGSGRGLKALAAKLTDVQAQQALEPLLQQVGTTTDPDQLRALACGLQALAAKLTEAQTEQAFDVLLREIGKATNGYVLEALAGALQAQAAKLTEAQVQRARAVAMSSLAWAAADDEAVSWARTIVALLPSPSKQDASRLLATTVIYPSAAGPATEVLLDALRERDLDAPAKEAGTAAMFGWIAAKFPKQVRRPICPTPPQPTSLSGLECPIEGRSATDATNP